MVNLYFHVILLSVNGMLRRTMDNKLHGIPFSSSSPKVLCNMGFESSVSMIVINININSIFGEIEVDHWKFKIPISWFRPVFFEGLNVVSFSILCLRVDQIYRGLELIRTVWVFLSPVRSMKIVVPFGNQAVKLV